MHGWVRKRHPQNGIKLKSGLGIFVSICLSWSIHQRYLSICTSTCLYTYVSTPVYLSSYTSTCLSSCLRLCLFNYLVVYLRTCMSFFFPIHLSTCLSSCLRLCLFNYLVVYLRICMSFFFPIHLSTCLSTLIKSHTKKPSISWNRNRINQSVNRSIDRIASSFSCKTQNKFLMKKLKIKLNKIKGKLK